MKEVEKNEIKRLSDRLDLIRHQMAGLSWSIPPRSTPSWKKSRHAGNRNRAPARSERPEAEQRSAEADEHAAPPRDHQKEQADMGKLKKSVRGLVVVHPMTELGREMGLKEMTGFCKTAF
jgi:ribosome-associated protein